MIDLTLPPVSDTTAALIDLLRQRNVAGRTDLTHAQWLQHLVEELLGGAQAMAQSPCEGDGHLYGPQPAGAEPVADDVRPLAGDDLLYRIDSYGLSSGLSDADFRQNVEPILEDVRGWLRGLGYVPTVWPNSEKDAPASCNPATPEPRA